MPSERGNSFNWTIPQVLSKSKTQLISIIFIVLDQLYGVMGEDSRKGFALRRTSMGPAEREKADLDDHRGMLAVDLGP